jgi:hypothetical protein
MKKILLSLLLFISVNVYAQQKGISYQAVILNPKGTASPGVDMPNMPLANMNVCMLFELVDASAQTEYQESIQTITDQYGMVNLTIGTGTRTGGSAPSFSKINWTTGGKKLVVKINMLFVYRDQQPTIDVCSLRVVCRECKCGKWSDYCR